MLVGIFSPETAQALRPVHAQATSQVSESVDFDAEATSRDAIRVIKWVKASGDNENHPFVVIDKVNARVYLFDHRAKLLGTAAALLGLGRGDDSVSGIGQRKLSTITPKERTTPAGRYVASLGNDFTQDILWVDYELALSLHRVITGNAKDRRHQRLASKTSLDNRISYGCINVPVDFYDNLIIPTFTGTTGIVYILPETKAIEEVFTMAVDYP